MKKKRPTIKDIAKKVGLSASSVSRALNDNPRISKATRDRVLTIAETIGYVPNFMARSLVRSKSNLIGLLVYDFRNTFYADLALVIQKTADDLGYRVIQASTHDDIEQANSLLNTMIEIGVDGIILAATVKNNRFVENLIDDGFPIVFANRRLNKNQGDYVVIDNARGAYLLTNHLIQLGNRRIAMIKGPDFASTSTERYKGFLAAMRENKLPIDNQIVKKGAFTQNTGFECTRQLIGLSRPPTAILCCDDEIAIGALRALEEAGIKVPENIALAGFDNSPISSHPRIQLTTVSQDVHQMGELCALYLANRIGGLVDSPQQTVLEPHLIIRETCGSLLGKRKAAKR